MAEGPTLHGAVGRLHFLQRLRVRHVRLLAQLHIVKPLGHLVPQKTAEDLRRLASGLGVCVLLVTLTRTAVLGLSQFDEGSAVLLWVCF